MNTPLFRILTAACCATVLLVVGCRKQVEQVDGKWTPGAMISSSIGGLGGAIVPRRLPEALVGVQVMHGGSASLYFWNHTTRSWSHSYIAGEPDATGWAYGWGVAAIDPQARRVLLPQGYAENEQLVFKALLGSLTASGELRTLAESKLVISKRDVFGETNRNVRMNALSNRSGAGFGIGVVRGADIHVPFAFDAKTFVPPKTHIDGPYINGVFHSTDAGHSWQMERVSDFYGGAISICTTTANLYYFGNGARGLWASRKSTGADRWGKPEVLSTTKGVVSSYYATIGDGAVAHVCWEDRRHNKWRFNIDGPPIENNDIYYRRRGDSDSEWSKEVQLSKGLLYCYAPSISAEGNNVVVAWAGVRTANKQHTDMAPNDIYYVTSKDAGRSWSAPLKVTDGAKAGLTAGMPQVALLKGTIHLLYTQGQSAQAKEISTGLTKLGSEPWPIYYTHRPFPN